MPRTLAFVPSGFGRPAVTAILAAAVGLGACGGDEDCSVTDSCPNQRPDVTITQPADEAIVVAGASVTFSGGAEDPEDGAITGQSLVWSSDLDGTLGMGATITVSGLSGGFHEIVLTATDSEGLAGADTITLGAGGAPLPEITSPEDNADGSPTTVQVGTNVTFTGSATDVEDGPIDAAELTWSSNVDGPLGTGGSIQVADLSPGMHTVTLAATDSDGLEGKATALIIVKPAAAPGFQIHIRWSEGVELSPAQQTAVSDAVARLESVITGDVPDIATTQFPDVGTCGGAAIPRMNESIDDVIIYLEFVPIDGPNGTIGSAGPCFTRNGTAQSLVGGMRFDTDDLQTLADFGLMDDIVLHEMMHVLGFGIFWEDPVDFLEQPSDPSNPEFMAGMTDTHFTGPEATAQFLAIGGDDYTGGEIVPVENDDSEFSQGSLDGHWRESVFVNEIMTTAANIPDNPLSVLTIGSFEDLGYTVDYGAADPYSQTFSVVLDSQLHAAEPEPAIDLSGDVWRGPLHAIDADGKARRIR